jgi:hypothetical protein
MMAQLKLNEIKSVIKCGEFNKEGLFKVRGSFFKKGGRRSFAVKRLVTVMKI